MKRKNINMYSELYIDKFNSFFILLLHTDYEFFATFLLRVRCSTD